MHDAGSTSDGRPYFVMEYVPGLPMTEYCDTHRLSIRSRLDLFTCACAAVQHAHQKGVIHRDLKPSNVLVTIVDDEPVPKVIDFGIAKATDQRAAERANFTQQAVMIGTPEYMSPEQADPGSIDVDTRTDLYSLGVILYELLVGVVPFDSRYLRDVGYSELVRIISDEGPRRPSTRIHDGADAAGIAERRQTRPATLAQLLRGDLDWITLRALEKDRARRYSSVSDLSADIERFLNNEPVAARPPSMRYRAGKFVRRNRLAVTAAALVALAVTGGLAASTVLYLREGRARADADADRDRATRMEAAAQRDKSLAESAAAAEMSARQRADAQTAVATDALALAETRPYFNNIALAERELEANNLALVDDLLATAPARLRNWEWHYLTRRSHKEESAIATEAGGGALAIDTRGERVFVESLPIVTIADARKGRVSRVVHLELDTPHGLAVADRKFSADGRVLAAAFWAASAATIESIKADSSVEVRVWDVETGKVALSLPAVRGIVRMALNPQGTRLVTWTVDGKDEQPPIRVWNIANKSEVSPLGVPQHGLNAMAFSADGGRLAFAGVGTIGIVDAQSGRPVMSITYVGLPGPKDDLEDLVWSRDGALLAARFPQGGIRVWNTADGKELWSSPSSGAVDSDAGIAFTRDGRHLIAAKSDHRLHLLDAASGREFAILSGSPRPITGLAVSSGSSRFVSGDPSGVVRVWNLSAAAEEPGVLAAGREIMKADISDDERHISVLDLDGNLSVFDAEAKRRLFAWSPPARSASEILVGSLAQNGPRSSVSLSRDGSRVAATFLRIEDNAIDKLFATFEHKLFDLRAARELVTLKQPGPEAPRSVDPNWGALLDGGMASLKLTPTGDHAIAIWNNGSAKVNKPVGAELGFINFSNRSVARVSLPATLVGEPEFSGDGRRAAFVANNMLTITYVIYDTTTGKRLREFAGSNEGRGALAITNDFRVLAGRTDVNEITIWNVETNALLVKLTCPSNPIDLALSPDGSRLVALSADNVLTVFDTAAGRQVAKQREPDASLRQWILTGGGAADEQPRVAFSNDGTRIVLTTVSNDPKGARITVASWSGAPARK